MPKIIVLGCGGPLGDVQIMRVRPSWRGLVPEKIGYREILAPSTTWGQSDKESTVNQEEDVNQNAIIQAT